MRPIYKYEMLNDDNYRKAVALNQMISNLFSINSSKK